MSREKQTEWYGRVMSMGTAEFAELREAVRARECSDMLGRNELSELASGLGREPVCPECGSKDAVKWGKSRSGEPRYLCKGCGSTFSLLTESVFASAKKHLREYALMLRLMSFNVPLDVVAGIVGVHHNTALLWRRKTFATVDEWQERAVLSGRVWIDEVYTFDCEMPSNHFGKNVRGHSKRKVCVCLAIDSRKSLVAFVAGHGIPTSEKIASALRGRIAPGSTIVHDGLHAHAKLIRELGVGEEIYKSTVKDEESLRAMALINSFSSWVKRYLGRFTGMRMACLQEYLNWFVYVFRVKEQDEKWPKDERIVRHLLLSKRKSTRRR